MAYIRYTQQALLNGVVTKKFPVLFNHTGDINRLVLNYLLECARGSAISSVGTYASHLLDLYNQLEEDSGLVELETIDEDYLIAYKASLIDRGQYQNTDNYASNILCTILRFFKWLEDGGIVRNLIGETENHRIRIKLLHNGNIKHPLAKVDNEDRRKKIAPRRNWIDLVKKYGPKTPNLNLRFELMIDWGMTAGLRAFEACFLAISQLPIRETVEKAIVEEKNIFMSLNVTKGSKEKSIPVSPLLIKKTLDYIDIERKSIVAKFKKIAKKNNVPYVESEYIFLSDKTGDSLLPRSFSNSIRDAFLAAVDAGELTEDERVWCHGLRHYFVVVLLKKLDEKKLKRQEAIARQATRHGSDDAMEPYLSERFNDDFK